MSQRRMFSPQIVDSDAFLEMPTSTQNLYFHFGMRADDDGFLGNYKKILKMVGGNEDDFKLLLAKRFVLLFEGGVLVLKHWRINNYIRKDRYKETGYLEEKNQLRVKVNGAYTLDEKQGLPIAMVPWKSDSERQKELGIPVGIPLVDAGKVRLGKDIVLQAKQLSEIPVDGETPKPSKVSSDTNPIVKYFHFVCERELGRKPLPSVAGLAVVKRARRRLSEEQCRDLVDVWFTRNLKDQELMSITRCFSDNEVNGYLISYAK